MILARVEHGRIQVDEPIPLEWEGQQVKIAIMTPDDPISDLENRLASLHALGAMEHEAGERDEISNEMTQLDALSKTQMNAIADVHK